MSPHATTLTESASTRRQFRTRPGWLAIGRARPAAAMRPSSTSVAILALRDAIHESAGDKAYDQRTDSIMILAVSASRCGVLGFQLRLRAVWPAMTTYGVGATQLRAMVPDAASTLSTWRTWFVAMQR
jgi:hypothetical protein